MKQDGSNEVRPGFTARYLSLIIVTGFITAVLGFVASYSLQSITKDSKMVEVATSFSENLAAVPESVASNMEVYLSIDPTKKQLVKSLFKYDATIRNTSEQGIDAFSIHFLPSEGITLAPNPSIASSPLGLLAALRIERIEVERGALYDVSLLNPEQSLSFAFFGFSTEEVNAKPLTVIVQKKDWMQRNVEQEDIGQNPRQNFLNKTITDYTGSDAVLLMSVIGMVAVGLGVYVQMFAVVLRRMEARRRERVAERTDK